MTSRRRSSQTRLSLLWCQGSTRSSSEHIRSWQMEGRLTEFQFSGAVTLNIFIAMEPIWLSKQALGPVRIWSEKTMTVFFLQRNVYYASHCIYNTELSEHTQDLCCMQLPFIYMFKKQPHIFGLLTTSYLNEPLFKGNTKFWYGVMNLVQMN